MRARSILHLTLSRLRDMARNSTVVFWLFGFPALAAIGLGMSLRDEPDPGASVGVLTADREAAARFVRALAAAHVSAQVLAPADAPHALESGAISMLVVPPVAPGSPVIYRYEIGSAAARMRRETVDAAFQRALGRRDAVSTRDEPLVGPGLRYIDFVVPGLIGLNVLSGSWSIAWALVSMRLRRILRLLRTMPVQAVELFFGLQLARAIFLPLEIFVLVALARTLFGFTIAGSWLSVLFVTLVSSVCFTGIAVLAASRSRQFEVASGILNLIGIPMVFLSGVFFSTARFPGWLRELVSLLPLAALLDALRRLMLRGAPLSSVLPQLAILVAWGIPAFIVGALVIRWES